MPHRRPNVVLITADNQPATLLGCHGNTDVATPNIDRLANQGARFEHAFAANGMCSPGRATIFTGLIPSRHGVHSWLDDHHLDEWPDDWCAVREFRTVPYTLSRRGYRTALIGKYHLGQPHTPMPGIDDWIAFATGHTWDFYTNTVMDNGTEYEIDDYHIVDFFTDKAVDYLSAVDTTERPFFLNINYDAPYLLPPANLGPDFRNRHYERFAGNEFRTFPRCAISDQLLARIDGPDTPDNFYRHHLFGYLRMHNDPATMANICAQIAVVDDGIGRVVDALDQRGLSADTLVLFTADQANLYGQHGLWGHTMDTSPSHLYDAGLHIPLIMRQPGSIPAGSVSDLLVGQYDLAPTLLDYCDIDVALHGSPGRSFAPALHGGETGDWADAVFFEQEETRGIRTSRYSYWKRLTGTCDAVLFDHEHDPDQEHDRAAEPGYREVVRELDRRLAAFFDRWSDPAYDVWRGGRAKGSVRRPEMYRAIFGDDWSPVAETADTFSEDDIHTAKNGSAASRIA